MSYNLFKGTELDNILWQTFKVLPTVYEEALSYLEQVCKLTQYVNEDRQAINKITDAVETFQVYVLEQLSQYDKKIIAETSRIINGLIEDGTIASLINNVLFGKINQDIATLENDVIDINSKLPNKIEMCINPILPPIEERKSNTLYLKVIDSMDIGNSGSSIQVNPTMGIKLV